jgi:alanyl-tRNA synthetase
MFLISDGVLPANKDRGYVLRRLIRRAMVQGKSLGLTTSQLEEVFKTFQSMYKDVYSVGTDEYVHIFSTEAQKFERTLAEGLKEFEKGADPFILATTYGFPIELTVEIAKEKGIVIDRVLFDSQMKAHQDASRAGAEQKFKGGLAGASEMEVKYHTATHMLHQALREVLGNHVTQKGSNITPDRLRFDFAHGDKMTSDEIKRVEDLVNEKIADNLEVICEEVPLETARARGALGVFNDKYEKVVKIYQVGKGEEMFSLEICGGPHVERTGTMGHFKIQKEEASSAGVRRIKAVLE